MKLLLKILAGYSIALPIAGVVYILGILSMTDGKDRSGQLYSIITAIMVAPVVLVPLVSGWMEASRGTATRGVIRLVLGIGVLCVTIAMLASPDNKALLPLLVVFAIGGIFLGPISGFLARRLFGSDESGGD